MCPLSPHTILWSFYSDCCTIMKIRIIVKSTEIWKNNYEDVVHDIGFFTIKSGFANVSERLTLRFQR